MKKCCHFTEERDTISHASPEETTFFFFSYRKAQILEVYQVKWNGGMPSRQANSLQKIKIEASMSLLKIFMADYVVYYMFLKLQLQYWDCNPSA